jgi:hypothetical protein
MSGGTSRRHSSFGFYVLSKTYFAIKIIFLKARQRQAFKKMISMFPVFPSF